jgi:hypothetical protein
MNPSESEALSKRIRWLNRRTLAVGLISVVLLIVAAGYGFSALSELIRFFGVGQRSAASLPIHIPGGLDQSKSSTIATFLMFGMALFGVWGMSTGSIRRSKCALAFIVMIACGVADFYLTAEIFRPIFGLTSQFEKAVNAGKYEVAEAIVNQLDYPEQFDKLNYLRAQIALRAGDKLRLKELATPILSNADLFVYGADKDPIAVSVYANTVGTYRADVIAAMDFAVHGRPISAVGLEQLSKLKGSSGNLRSIFLALLWSALLLGLALTFAWTWKIMRRHLLNILDAGFSPD